MKCSRLGRSVLLAVVAATICFGDMSFAQTKNRQPIRNNFSGKGSDLTVFHPAPAKWYISSLGGQIVGWGLNWGTAEMIPVPGNYKARGSGPDDLALYEPSTGSWYIRHLDGPIILWKAGWGTSDMIPVPGDYDGDWQSDLALYQPSSGKWFIRRVSGRVIANGAHWGTSDMIPVPGDYDGDGKADLALYQPSTGKWYIRTVAGKVLVSGQAWGTRGMIPVPGDYNGNGKADLALFQPTTGLWYIRTVAGRILVNGQSWGTREMIPVSGDFNGDGKYDMALYDQTRGLWYIRSVSGTILAWRRGWGGSGMIASGASTVNAPRGWDKIAPIPGAISVNLPYSQDWILEADFYGLSAGVWDKFFQQGLEALSVFPGRAGRMSVRLANGQINFLKGQSLVGSVSTFGPPDHYAWTIAGLPIYSGDHKMRMEYRFSDLTLKFFWDGDLVGWWRFRIDKMPPAVHTLYVRKIKSGELRYRVGPISDD